MGMKIDVLLDEGAYMPERAHYADAGLDLRTPYNAVIPPMGSATIDTGVHIEIPPWYFGKLESKSGLNIKHSVVSLGGVIDSGYTGSIVVKLYNLSDKEYWFKKGDKIVQLIIQPCCIVTELNQVYYMAETERGDGGFGSTGR